MNRSYLNVLIMDGNSMVQVNASRFLHWRVNRVQLNEGVPSFAVKEQQGHIWIFGAPNTTPNHDPFSFPHFEDGAYSHVHFQADFFDGTLHANLEKYFGCPAYRILAQRAFSGC